MPYYVFVQRNAEDQITRVWIEGHRTAPIPGDNQEVFEADSARHARHIESEKVREAMLSGGWEVANDAD
jgi:hypothetical protein